MIDKAFIPDRDKVVLRNSHGRPTVYLGGTIDRLNPDMVVEAFARVEKRLRECGFNVLNPVRGKKVAANHKDFHQYEPNEIVHRDLADITKSDFMLAMMAKPSIGLSMEIMYARERGIPVVVISNNPAVTGHYWIRALASNILGDVEEAVEYLREWYL